MAKQQKPMVNLPPVTQIGIVVKDVDKAMEHYSSIFGWGPFNVLEVEFKKINFKGKLIDYRTKIALAQSGPVEVELIQILEGETPHTEFLRERGEGVHHLGYHVDDLDGLLAEFAKYGIKPVWSKSFPWMAYAYLNTDEIGGLMLELVEIKDKEKLAEVSKVSKPT